MTLKNLLLSLFIIGLVPLRIHAELTCDKLFDFDSSKLALTPSFSHEIPKEKQLEISEVIEKIKLISKDLKLPEQISFLLDHSKEHIGAAHLAKKEIYFMPQILSLPKEIFQAIVAHEITHFIVARNFSSMSSYESLEDEISDPENNFTLGSEVLHGPYAELICDLMSVMILQDPQAISKLLPEVVKFAKNGEWSSENFQSHPEFYTNPLFSRDFSISPEDPRWLTFKAPESKFIEIYARFNQISSYLWYHWVIHLKPEQFPQFFSFVVNTLNKVYQNQPFNYLIYPDKGLYESNRMLIQALDEEFSKVFGKL